MTEQTKPRNAINRDNVWRRNMTPKLEAVGLAWATYQVMRRTNGSISHKAGIDRKVAADQGGHRLGVAMEVHTQSDLDQKLDAARLATWLPALSNETDPVEDCAAGDKPASVRERSRRATNENVCTPGLHSTGAKNWNTLS